VTAETINDLLEWRRARGEGAARAWLRYESDTWSLDDALDAVDRFAVGLEERGVVRGSTVAILAGNVPATLFAWFASNRLGASAAPLNPAYKPPELAGVLALIEPRVLVVADDLRELATAALATLPDLRAELASPAELARAGRGSARVAVSPDDVAVLIATSGTTGAPKAVMQTHRTYALTAEAFPWWLGLDESDVLYCPLPLFHVNAEAYSTMGSLACGGGLALVPRFSASRFWDDVRRYGATEVNVVGAMIHILMRAPRAAGETDHGLRLCYTALALSEEQHRAFEARFGVTMTVGYGLSESTFGTVWPNNAKRNANGTAPPYGTMGGLRQHPRLGTINKARVVTEGGADAADGETGELWLSNPATMRGYLKDPEQTASVLVDGWLRTGDLVRRDGAGNYTFVARKKEVLRRRGENVAAGEIEGVLAAHPDVLEAAVVGAPSELGEDDIVAFVAPRPGARIDADRLREFTRERLADYKVPTRIHVVDGLPRTATERVAKHLLREPR
jgi:crotonobetaine/carnitine-CoA ligase